MYHVIVHFLPKKHCFWPKKTLFLPKDLQKVRKSREISVGSGFKFSSESKLFGGCHPCSRAVPATLYQSIFCTCSFPAYKHDVLASDRQSPQTCVEKFSWMDHHYEPVLQNQFIIFGFSFQHCLFYICLLYSSYIACNLNCTITANLLCKRTRLIPCVINPSLLWTCMLSIEYHFNNNKGFWIFYLKAEEERCSKFAKRSRSVVIYQKMLNSAVFQNSAEFCDP